MGTARTSRPRADRTGRRVARTLAGSVLASALSVPCGSAQLLCEEVGRPAGGTVTIRVQVDDPPQGTVFEADDRCRLTVPVSGRFGVEADFSLDHDFYLVVDQSASTANASGVDVDGNGTPGDVVEDSIFSAEVTACRRFVDALDPATSRVAVIGFAWEATAYQPLTSDLDQVRATLDGLLGEPPGGGTTYSSALDAVHEQAITRGDPGGRIQRLLFLSDGNPILPDPYQPAALRLAELGVRADTFALDVPTADALADIAEVTGGDFHQLTAIGDILDVLPGEADELTFDLSAVNAATGRTVVVDEDRAAGTFTASAALVPGPNVLELSITVPSSPPTVLTCGLELELRVPRPAPIGPALRVLRPRDDRMLLHWEAAPEPGGNESDVVFASDRPDEGFAPLARRLGDRQLLQPLPPDRVLFYDVRREACEHALSED